LTVTRAGSISGQIRISARQAIAEYAALRVANATTRTALLTSSAAFTKVGVAALAGAAPIALLFKSAITGAAQFQKKIDYFGAVTGASQADMEAVAQKAKDMARTTVYSAADMADAMVEFGKAGVKTKDILGGVLDATANLAQAADISMAEASNVMASQLATFNLGAKDAAHVADELAGAANASIIDVSDLAYSLKYAGGIAASTGISFDQVVTALSLLGKRGIKGSQAGTSLRMIMISLLGATKQARGALQDLGLLSKDMKKNAFVDARGHIRPLADDMEILRKAEEHLTQAQQLQINKTIFNTRALSALQILMHQGKRGFREMSREIGNVTAMDVAHKRLDNLAGDWTRFRNNIKTTLIEAGGPLQNFLRQIVQGLTHLVQGFSHLSAAQQKYIIYGAGVVGLFLTFVGVMSLVIATVLRTIYVFQQLKAAFILIRGVMMQGMIMSFFRAGGGLDGLRLRAMMMGDAIKNLLVKLGLMTAANEGLAASEAELAVAEEGATVAATEMDVAMDANPIGLIALAIAGLIAAIVLLVVYFKQVSHFLHGPWGTALSVAMLAVNPLIGIAMLLIGHWKAVWNFLKSFGQGAARIFMDIYHAVEKPVMAVVNFLKGHWQIIVALILLPYTLAVVFLANVWKLIGGTVKTAMGLIITGLRAAWQFIVGVIRVALNMILGVVRMTWNFIHAIIMGQVHLIEAGLRLAWNGIKTAAGVAWTAIRLVILPIVRGIAHGIVAIFNAIKGPISAAFHFIGNVLSTVFHTLIQPTVAAIHAAIHGIAVVIHALSTAWGDAWGTIGDILNTVYNATLKPIIDMIQGGIGAIKSGLNDVKNIAGGLGHAVSGVLHAGGKLNPLNWDDGGWVPGHKGQPVHGTVHGGEYVLSTDMMAGRRAIDPHVLQALAAAQSRAMVGSGNVALHRNHPSYSSGSMENGRQKKHLIASGSLEISRDSTGELRAWVQDMIAEEQDFQASLRGMH
jgi:TP901 family phage tail tape measure protein